MKDRGCVRSHGKSGKGVRQKLFIQGTISDQSHLSEAAGVLSEATGVLRDASFCTRIILFYNHHSTQYTNPAAISCFRTALIIDVPERKESQGKPQISNQ